MPRLCAGAAAALAKGYEALEMALLAARGAGSHEHDDWRHNEPPPIPPMSVNQALQLIHLHRKAALMLDEPDYLKRRRSGAGEGVRRKVGLPDLAQVTGWSRADPGKQPHGDSALFGGWRIEDMERKREGDEWDLLR